MVASMLLAVACAAPQPDPSVEIVDVDTTRVAEAPSAAVVSPVPAVDPDRYAIWGIDVSHHQHAIDWQEVARQPRIRFAFLKATEGRTWNDSEFQRNWPAARAAGLRVGAYHYFTFCSDGRSQAEHFLAVVPKAPDALPAVLDVEHLMNCPPDPDPDKVRAELRIWLETVEAATGRRPIVYATSDVLADYFLGSDLDYPLWVRATPEDPEPVLELPWTFLQYDDQHEIAGIVGAVDHDVFASDDAAFAALQTPRP